MKRVLVVTDSSTCLPEDLIEELEIRVLPISARTAGAGDVHAGGPEENTTWTVAESIEREELESANHPFVTEYLEAVETPGYEAAVIVTPAIEFATMFRNAALATELSTRATKIIDSRTAAAGQALVVLAGAESAARGADLAEVVRAIEDASRRVVLVAALATLEPMRRSGPVPEEILGLDALAGTRSVFRMHDGNVEQIGPTGSLDDALETIRTVYIESTATGRERSTVFHADVPELAERLVDLLKTVDFVSGFSIAMQVHTGRGVVGAAWIP